MVGTVCFTSFSLGYLARARVLARSVKAAHPDWAMVALLVDAMPPALEQSGAFAPFDRVVTADTLAIPRFPGWIFKHDLVEACTAMKAPMLLALLDRGCRQGDLSRP